MNSIIIQILPIVSLIVLGFLLKQGGILRADDGYGMARVILNATLPALIFLSIAEANVPPHQLALLGLCGVLTSLALRIIGGWVASRWKLDRPVAGVVVLGSMIINIGFFLFPFFQAFFGKEGISRLAAFDVGQSIMANSYGYYLAISFGDKAGLDARTIARRVLAIPTLWAGVLGLLVSLANWQMPSFIVQILEPLSAANTPLAMLTLGSFIRPNYANWKWVTLVVGLRMVVGWMVGQLLVFALGLNGIERAVVASGAAMPVGMVVLVYAATEQLDTELAAGAISLSILLGLIVTPFLLGWYV